MITIRISSKSFTLDMALALKSKYSKLSRSAKFSERTEEKFSYNK